MKRKQKNLHERAIRLVEGGVVSVDGNAVRAFKAPLDMHPCLICKMDCLCHRDEDTEIVCLCEEVDNIGKGSYYLKLENTK